MGSGFLDSDWLAWDFLDPDADRAVSRDGGPRLLVRHYDTIECGVLWHETFNPDGDPTRGAGGTFRSGVLSVFSLPGHHAEPGWMFTLGCEPPAQRTIRQSSDTCHTV